MRILLDHNVTRHVRPHLSGHDVRTTREQGWDRLGNGVLLRAAAADGGFDVFLTIDKKMEYEQNLRRFPLPIVMLDAISNDLADLLPFVPAVLDLLSAPLAPALYVMAADGTVTRVAAPRPKP